ncbi:unnamed protein product [Brassicogethes aeneus]|uniref:Uncharacterized protein n=1 Tax=Brassicogethes aeneus TaxID=1431903 RepID=A0A9P0B4D1_BRAAE|nr:unnamed protein product [Brassicogethes aeneus]
MTAKIILVLVACLFATISSMEIPSELKEFIDDLHDACIKKSGISDDDHTNYDIMNKDPNMMEYMKCLMLDSKWMSPSGEIQYDFIEETAHPKIKDILMTAMNKCRDIPESTSLAEKAYNFNLCMYKADPLNWFFV